METGCVYFIMATLRVYKRNSTSVELTNLVEEISRLGLVDALQIGSTKN
jgi:hypothetical protein